MTSQLTGPPRSASLTWTGTHRWKGWKQKAEQHFYITQPSLYYKILLAQLCQQQEEKTQNTPTSGITMPTKPPIEIKRFSKPVIWSVQFLSFNQMILEQPKASLWQYFIVLSSEELCYLHILLFAGVTCISPKGLLCAGQSLTTGLPLTCSAQPHPAPVTAPKQDTLESLPAYCLRGYGKELLPRVSTGC